MLNVPFLTPCSVSIHLHDIVWFPLRVSLRTLRLRDPTAPRPYILQHHGRATVAVRAEMACASQNAYAFNVDRSVPFALIADA